VADLGFEKGGFKVGEAHVRTRCAAVGLTLTWYVRTRTRSEGRLRVFLDQALVSTSCRTQLAKRMYSCLVQFFGLWLMYIK